MRIQLEVTGMTCGGCKASVERVLGAQQGVHTVSVDLPSGRAVVEAADGAVPEDLVSAIGRAGYDARVIA